jgi:hypothetical protein
VTLSSFSILFIAVPRAPKSRLLTSKAKSRSREFARGSEAELWPFAVPLLRVFPTAGLHARYWGTVTAITIIPLTNLEDRSCVSAVTARSGWW